MKKLKIGVFDSGIGGLIPLKVASEKLANVDFYYLGDNGNAPYGQKSNLELLSLAFSNVNYLLSYNVDCVLVGCNTISTSVLGELKTYFSVPIFGVFPPCEKGLLNGETLLISTPKTAENFVNLSGINIVRTPFLAGDIERHILNKKSLNLSFHLSSVKKRYKQIILGCTHYELIKNEIIDHLKPLEILSGTQYCVNKIKNYYNLKNNAFCEQNNIYFIGKYAFYNSKVFYSVVKSKFDMTKK